MTKTGDSALKTTKKFMTNVIRILAKGLFMVGLCFFFGGVTTAWADVTVQSLVDRNEMDPGDTFQLDINVSSDSSVDITQPQAPEIAGFELVNQGQSREARAGVVQTPQGSQFKTVHTQHFIFVYQATQVGNFTVGAVDIHAEGKTYRTKPITLKVAQGASQQARRRNQGGGLPGSAQGNARGRGQQQAPAQTLPGFGQDPDDEADDLFNQLLRRHGIGGGIGIPGGGQPIPRGVAPPGFNANDAFFIQVEVDKSEVYAGEQVTASWYLYTKGAIRDIDTLKYPDLKGFWKEDIEIATQLNFTQEVINGIPYRKALLASYALFPIKEGSATIDSYKAKCTVIGGDPFGFGNGPAYTYTKVSRELKINVKPLPAEGRPTDFSGAVGQFQVTARVDEPNIVTNQPFSFHVRFDGKGNAKLIDVPPFTPPTGIENYETQKEAKFFKQGTSYKDFNILLIPRQEGDFTLPPISVSMFDPQSKKYVSRTTEPVIIHVRRGSNDSNVKGSPLAGTPLLKDKIPAEFKPDVIAGYSAPMYLSTRDELMIFGLAILAMLVVLYFKARFELGWGAKKQDLLRQTRVRFKRIYEQSKKNQWRTASIEVTNAVYAVMGTISGLGGAHVELEKLLEKAPPSVRREIGESLTKLMEKFHMLSFAPEEVAGNLKEPAVFLDLVQQAEKLMLKAVSLGVNDEPGGEPEKAPTTS